MNKKNSPAIKNPERNKSAAGKKIDPYQPEYLRLGMEVANPLPISPSNFPKFRKKEVSTLTKTEVHRYPEQGQTREHVWYPSEADDLERTEQYVGAKIPYDQVPSPYEKAPNVSQSENSLSWKEILPGQYVIVADNEIVSTADTLDEIEDLIESLIFNPESPYHGFSVEGISVFQRLELKFGISIKK